MAKDDRSALNPFTGREHHDNVNDDQFLAECYDEYYKMLNKAQIADNTPEGQLVNHVAHNLISAVLNYLSSIGRLDYVEDYYDWEFHHSACLGEKSLFFQAFCLLQEVRRNWLLF